MRTLEGDPTQDDARMAALTAALQRTFDMEVDDAEAVSEVIAEAFSGREEIDDDGLDAEVRAVFYTLEAKRILAFRSEERKREAGKKWRAFYWRVRHDELQRILNHEDAPVEQDVYGNLPADVWTHRAGIGA